MSRFTRRQLLSAGLGTAAMGLLSGCATPGIRSVNTAPVLAPAASGEKITLTYWCWLKDAQKVADIWNASHPNVQVETVWIPGGNSGGYQKLYSALAAGGGPDRRRPDCPASRIPPGPAKKWRRRPRTA